VLHNSNFCCRVWVPVLTEHTFFSVPSSFTIHHILPKKDSLGHICVANSIGLNFNHCEVIGPKCPNFSEITQNNAITLLIQGHQFLPVCNFLCVKVVTFFLSCTINDGHVVDYWSNFRPRRGCLFNVLVRMGKFGFKKLHCVPKEVTPKFKSL